MLCTTLIKSGMGYYGGRVLDYFRTSFRRVAPSYSVKAIRENEFLHRLIAMTLFSAFAGLATVLMPAWSFRFWLDGALLGAALSLGASHTQKPWTFFLHAGMGVFLGCLMQGFVKMGFPYLGMATLGAGIGAQMSEEAMSFRVRIATLLLTVASALLGGWATMKLSPAMRSGLPTEMSAPMLWGILGLFFALGALPLHAVIVSNPVIERVTAVTSRLKKEYRVHLDKMLDRYSEFRREAPRKADEDLDVYLRQRDKMEEALMDTAETCLSLQELDRGLNSVSDNDILDRRQELDERMKTVDEDLYDEIQTLIADIDASLLKREKLKLERERLKLRLLRIEMDVASALL